MARKRRFSTFSLSFLDIMSCGFGAVALIFLIIKHDVDKGTQLVHEELQAEVNLLEEDVRDGKEGMVRARNTLSALDQRLATAKGLASRIQQNIYESQARLDQLEADNSQETITQLEQRLQRLQQEKDELEAEQQERGNDVRRYVGQGNRQYLTGLKLGGSRILILLDASASMLDERLVNIIRRRNMAEDDRRAAEKWQRALATVDWLTTQLPEQSRYQIYTFNTEVQAASSGTENTWLDVSNKAQLEQSMLNLRKRVPRGGTSLHNTFAAIQLLPNPPDNIYLITDGLPTQDIKKPKGNTVSGAERVKLFNQAVEQLPSRVPINIILAPMEGDPLAAAAFWQLAQVSDGSFMSPSRDWP